MPATRTTSKAAAWRSQCSASRARSGHRADHELCGRINGDVERLPADTERRLEDLERAGIDGFDRGGRERASASRIHAGPLPAGPPRVHQREYGRIHPATTDSCETLALQGFLYLVCPPGPALYTAEHDS
jgi:hypothetical protein